MILYEHPFSERIRTWLRLERLFDRLATLQRCETARDHHFALVTLFEILDVASRPDLKTEIMRDLDKHKQQLNAYRGNPAIAESMLEQTLAEVQQCFAQLEQATGKLGQSLADNEFLTAIRSRISIPGGTCEFDLPAYHAWQHEPDGQRQQDLLQWSSCLQAVAKSVKLLLMLLRSTGQPQKMTARGGQFQQNLPQGRTFQLLRLQLAPQLQAIPETSANRLMISVRMMQREANGHLAPRNEDVDFQLTLCA